MRCKYICYSYFNNVYKFQVIWVIYFLFENRKYNIRLIYYNNIYIQTVNNVRTYVRT